MHFICGAGLKQLHQKAAEATQEQKSEVDTIIGDCQWSSLEDAELIVYAKKLFVHITRLLHVLTHVIEQTNPLVNAAKVVLYLLLCLFVKVFSCIRKFYAHINLIKVVILNLHHLHQYL